MSVGVGGLVWFVPVSHFFSLSCSSIEKDNLTFLVIDISI
jgi:hypothetical protein